VSGLRRHWKKRPGDSFDRGLTARPVVLAKTYEPGASRSRREVATGLGVPLAPIGEQWDEEIGSEKRTLT